MYCLSSAYMYGLDPMPILHYSYIIIYILLFIYSMNITHCVIFLELLMITSGVYSVLMVMSYWLLNVGLLLLPMTVVAKYVATCPVFCGSGVAV